TDHDRRHRAAGDEQNASPAHTPLRSLPSRRGTGEATWPLPPGSGSDRMTPNEIENEAVEKARLLPVRRVADFAQDGEFYARLARGHHSARGGRRVEVGVAVDEGERRPKAAIGFPPDAHL